MAAYSHVHPLDRATVLGSETAVPETLKEDELASLIAYMESVVRVDSCPKKP